MVGTDYSIVVKKENLQKIKFMVWCTHTHTWNLNTDFFYFSTKKIRNDIHSQNSLEVNHNRFTRQKQSDFKLLVKRWKCIQSMFYFSAQLYNHVTWGFWASSLMTQPGPLEVVLRRTSSRLSLPVEFKILHRAGAPYKSRELMLDA